MALRHSRPRRGCKNASNSFGGQLDRQHAVLQAVLAKNIGEAFGDDAADAVGDQRPLRRLARRAAAEVAAGNQDRRIAKLRLVQNEIGVFAAVGAAALTQEQHLAIIRVEAAHHLLRRDLVGGDVVADVGHRDAGERGERLHVTRSPPRGAHVGDAARDGRRCDGLRAGEMRAHAGALPALEIAIGGRDAALAWRAPVAVAARAHRAAGFAPGKAGIAKHSVEPSRFGMPFHRGRPRHHHRDDARRDLAAAHHRCGGFEVRQSAVGAGADEDAVDRQAGKRRTRLQRHVVERALHCRFPFRRNARHVRHAAGNSDHLARIGAPRDLRLKSIAVDRQIAIERGVVVAVERAPIRERLHPRLRPTARTAVLQAS